MQSGRIVERYIATHDFQQLLIRLKALSMDGFGLHRMVERFPMPIAIHFRPTEALGRTVKQITSVYNVDFVAVGVSKVGPVVADSIVQALAWCALVCAARGHFG